MHAKQCESNTYPQFVVYLVIELIIEHIQVTANGLMGWGDKVFWQDIIKNLLHSQFLTQQIRGVIFNNSHHPLLTKSPLCDRLCRILQPMSTEALHHRPLS